MTNPFFVIDDDRKPLQADTFALIMATAVSSLRTVRAAYDDDPEIASKMPMAWRKFLAEVTFFHEEFGRAIIKKE